MRAFIKEYLDVFMYTICGVLIIIGSYNVIVNIYHSRHLNERIVVREIDNNYKEYKSNVINLETILLNKNSSSQLYNALKYSLGVLKNEGAYRLLPGDLLGYKDVYELNNYFIDHVINESWIINLQKIDNNVIDQDYVKTLINNSNYVNKELLNNSNFHYDVKGNDIRNTLEEEYGLIIRNYRDYSLLLIELAKGLGDSNA